jgi:nucleoside-diphosphate-sugar epimerase
MNNMKACVTGASGFIGRHLIRVLCEQGYTVAALSRKEQVDFPSEVRIIKGDLISESCELERFLESCDVLFHCAGEIRDDSKMAALHIDGTQNLVNVALTKIQETQRNIHWVQLSSVGVYGPVEGESNKDRTVTEQSPIKPRGHYEVTKAVSDGIVTKASERAGFTYSIVRPSNVIGEGMPNSSLKNLAKIIKKGFFTYIGKKGAISTYVHIDDVINLLVTCAEDVRARGEVFNISNDCLLEDVVNSVADEMGAKRPKLSLPESLVRVSQKFISKLTYIPLSEQGINVLTSRTIYPYTKLQKCLDYKPKISIAKSIGNIVVKELSEQG